MDNTPGLCKEEMVVPVPILLYHSITDDATPRYRRWTVSPAMFAAQLAYLHEHHYTPITVSQLVHAFSDTTQLPSRPIVLTFDDGLADFYTNALPILAKHHFRATLYITTGYVGGTSRWLAALGEGERPMLQWSQLSEIDAAGIE